MTIVPYVIFSGYALRMYIQSVSRVPMPVFHSYSIEYSMYIADKLLWNTVICKTSC